MKTEQRNSPYRAPRVSQLITLTVILLGCAQQTIAQHSTTINNNSGNVGVSTNSPRVKLDILSPASMIARFNSPAPANTATPPANELLVGNISSHTQLYPSYDSQANMILEIGYGTASPDITPLPSLVLSKNLTDPNQGLGVISFANSSIANGNQKRLSFISSWTDGALNSGALMFGTTLTGVLSERMRITALGNIGIGTTSPTEKLEVSGTVKSSGLTVTGAPAEQPHVNALYLGMNGTRATIEAVDQMVDFRDLVISNKTFQVKSWNGGDLVTGLFQNNAGNVGIGTTTPGAKLEVTGNINVTGTGNITATGTIEGGNVKAKYQDVAEWVPAAHTLLPGTVVALDPTKSNHVAASSQAYDTRVAGVVSAQPGIVLGEQAENKVLVATTGRVRVKVDATNGPIRIGDLLVTSNRAGFAMKSVPVEIGSARIHRPGTLIGKALESLSRGTGEILVLLSLQ